MKLAKVVTDEKIKDTKIGKFLAEKVPHVLNLLEWVPEQGTLGIEKNLL